MSKLSLIDNLIEGLTSSGYTVSDFLKNDINMYEISLRKIKEIKIHVFLKKVSKAGWKNQPMKRRVQVTAFDLKDLPPSGDKVTCMILGIQEVFDRIIFVAWNIYNYGNHATNRSCYVHTTNIYQAFLKGYLSTVDQSHKIWLADKFNLDKLINTYMEYNYSSIGE